MFQKNQDEFILKFSPVKFKLNLTQIYKNN